MRILILGLNFTPELTGIGKYTGEMVQFLTRIGHHVHVVTTPPYYPHWYVLEGYRAWAYQREIIDQAEVNRCPLWVPRQPRGLNRVVHLASFGLTCLPIMFAQSFWKPDLVMCIAPAIASAPAALLTARLVGSKTWIHIQDFELDAALRLEMLPALNRIAVILQWFERTLLNQFDHISTISQRMLDHLAHKGLPTQKTSLLVNWVDCDQIFPSSSLTSLRAEWKIAAETLIILYAGNMGQKQGLETLIDGARLLQDDQHFQFVLCGEGAARAALQQQAIGLRNVHFFPLQPVERLNELLSTADIHVLTQRINAADLVMPSKLSGMLASGRPVIATAQPGTELASVIEQVGILIPPENPFELAQAIQRLAHQPDLRLQLGQRGRAFALAHWDKESVLNHLNQEVESLCQ